jgi:hypothetical protein
MRIAFIVLVMCAVGWGQTKPADIHNGFKPMLAKAAANMRVEGEWTEDDIRRLSDWAGDALKGATIRSNMKVVDVKKQRGGLEVMLQPEGFTAAGLKFIEGDVRITLSGDAAEKALARVGKGSILVEGRVKRFVVNSTREGLYGKTCGALYVTLEPQSP